MEATDDYSLSKPAEEPVETTEIEQEEVPEQVGLQCKTLRCELFKTKIGFYFLGSPICRLYAVSIFKFAVF